MYQGTVTKPDSRIREAEMTLPVNRGKDARLKIMCRRNLLAAALLTPDDSSDLERALARRISALYDWRP
jgi:hypothetical protein